MMSGERRAWVEDEPNVICAAGGNEGAIRGLKKREGQGKGMQFRGMMEQSATAGPGETQEMMKERQVKGTRTRRGRGELLFMRRRAGLG
jgi:hypothetical protein